MDWAALALSFKLALVTSTALLFFALPLAFWISQNSGKLGARLLESLSLLPQVLPPTVLGFYLLLGLSRFNAAFSFGGLVLASILYSFPFAFQAFLTAFQGIDRNLLEVSATLGESKMATFFRIVLPLGFHGVVAGFILAFTHTLGEFGVVLMVGGNIPGVSRTLAISLYDSVEALDFHAARNTSLFLLVVSFVAVFAMTALKPKVRVTA